MSTYADINSGDRLSFTLFIAATLHAVIIFGIEFTVDSGTKVAPTLNITLATHDNKTPPEKADFIAQHNQLASGTESEVKELTTREEAKLNDVNIREISPNPQQKASVVKTADSQVITTQVNAQHRIDQKPGSTPPKTKSAKPVTAKKSTLR